MNNVHHKIFSKKKIKNFNLIKSNQMRQNFGKIKISKIIFLLKKKCFKCIIDCLALPVNARTMCIH